MKLYIENNALSFLISKPELFLASGALLAHNVSKICFWGAKKVFNKSYHLKQNQEEFSNKQELEFKATRYFLITMGNLTGFLAIGLTMPLVMEGVNALYSITPLAKIGPVTGLVIGIGFTFFASLGLVIKNLEVERHIKNQQLKALHQR